MTHHRLVQARSIAVVGAVHLRWVVRVIELKKPRVRAPYELEGPGGHARARGPRKHARQRLRPEIQDAHQVLAAARAALRDLGIGSLGHQRLLATRGPWP